MDLLLWIFLGLALLLWTAGWGVFLRLRGVPAQAIQAEPGLRLSIVVPARNEEDNLSRLLPSLRDPSFAPHEILVVDDHSSDRTAAVAREHGATAIAGADLPAGWYGKPWACQQGADAATGDWLLFLDADLVALPGGLRRLAALAAQEPGAVHSVCPWHRVERPYEELSAFFNAVMILGTNAFTAKGPRARETGLFGQAMLLSKASYEAVGGHRRVKAQVLENFLLSRHFREAGIACRCYLGGGVLAMRMFPGGVRDLVAGWSKGFVSGAGNTPRAAMFGIATWISGLVMVALSPAFLPVADFHQRLSIGGLYFLGAMQCLHVFRHAGSFAFLNALFFPVSLLFYQFVFFRALRRRKAGGKVSWKGRDVA
jgi:4,4'-diaponeurosporenoate glycosyltransferase